MTSNYIVYEILPGQIVPNQQTTGITLTSNPNFYPGPSYGLAGINDPYSASNPDFGFSLWSSC